MAINKYLGVVIVLFSLAACNKPDVVKDKSPSLYTGKVYEKLCAACHNIDGSGIPGVFPNLTDRDIYNQPVDTLVGTIVFGVSGTSMQRFGDMIDENEMIEVVQYIQSKFGNVITNKDELTLSVQNAYKVIMYDAEQRNLNYDYHVSKLNSYLFPAMIYTTSLNVYKKNNPKIAIEGFKIIIKKYPDSPYAKLAIEELNKFSDETL